MNVHHFYTCITDLLTVLYLWYGNTTLLLNLQSLFFLIQFVCKDTVIIDSIRWTPLVQLNIYLVFAMLSHRAKAEHRLVNNCTIIKFKVVFIRGITLLFLCRLVGFILLLFYTLSIYLGSTHRYILWLDGENSPILRGNHPGPPISMMYCVYVFMIY